MHITILSRNESLYSTHLLKEAGKTRGPRIDIIDTFQFYIDITSSQP